MTYTVIVGTLYNCCSIRTWKSSKLADEMIDKLEEQGLQMAKQRQEYFGKYSRREHLPVQLS